MPKIPPSINPRFSSFSLSKISFLYSFTYNCICGH
nr:MAG TPA: hypothetical protein [Caudoviricetes sp.]